MANPYHGETAQQDKAGGKGVTGPGAAKAPKMKYKTGGFPGLPGKRGPERNKWKAAKKVSKHTMSEGL